ncbi:MAG: hypothetical protein M3Q48_02850 [Actinomycetota bacterium]|nr:hypothetical protein [Actinomycetota bacterium]
MRLRLGFVLGFGSGYYLGAMAGRERYEQINRKLRQLRRSDAYEAATDAARDAVETGVEKARDFVESATGNGDEPGYDTTPYTSPGTDR